MSETENVEKKKGWRWGVNRWLVLAVIIFGVWITGMFPPARPAIFLPAEAVFGSEAHPLFTIPFINAPFYITNTLIATLIADIFLLLVVFFAVAPSYRKGKLEVPKGIAGIFEALSEVFYSLTETTAGKWTTKIFPWFAAISMLVLTMNWMELIPSVDAWGVYEPHHVVTYVYGEAQLSGKSCIVSLFRLKNRGSNISTQAKTLVDRAIKEAVHELGHTFGLRHCPDHACLMHYCRSIDDVDRKSDQFCRYCQIMLDDVMPQLPQKC